MAEEQKIENSEATQEKTEEPTKETSQDSQDEFSKDMTEYLTSQDDLDDNPIPGEKKEEQTQNTETDKTEKKEEASPFDFASTNEKGETVFDSKSAYDFVTKKPETEFKPELKIEKPVEKQVTDEKVPTYEENLRSNLQGSLELFKKYREMGYDETISLSMAERDIDGDIRNHVQDKAFNDRLAKVDEREKEATDRASTMELKPKSTTNINNAVRRGNWGSSERLYKALMDKDIGGTFLAKQYQRENPDKNFSSMEEYTKALKGWFIRYSADEESLMMAEEYAKAKIFLRNFPKLMEQARNTKAKVDTEKKESKVKGTSTKQTSTSSKVIGMKGDLSYLDVKL